MQEMIPATVIGAGPAGALTAALLAKCGVQVRLIDKNNFPRHKVCGCCLSPTAIRALRQAGAGDVFDSLPAVPLHTLRLYRGAQHVDLPIRNSYSISRAALDNALIEYAKTQGVEFQRSVAACGVITPFARRIELDNDESFPTKVAIAADGLAGSSLKKIPAMRSITSVQSKIGTGAISSAQASVYEAGIIYMIVGSGGYVGLVRLEDGSLDIAAALDPDYLKQMHNPADAIARLLQSARLPLPEDLNALDFRGTVALTRTRSKFAAERVFAIGDAASYVEPFTGEGIAWALISALNVVPIAARASTVWNDVMMKQWEEIYNKEVRARQTKTSILARVLRHDALSAAGAEILARSPKLSSLLVEYVHA